MNQIKRIFVVGHPGAGKGLFAKTLAEERVLPVSTCDDINFA